MAQNGKTKVLTKEQHQKLKKSVSEQDNLTLFFAGKGILLPSIRRPLETGKVSERLYKKLVAARLV